MRSRLVTQVLAGVLLLGACGGSSGNEGEQGQASTVERYQGCSNDGEEAQGADGSPLKCMMNSAGELMWDLDPEGEFASGSYMSLNAVFGDKCDPNGPTSYTAGIGSAEQWSHVVPLGAMLTTHITPIDHIYVFYPQGTEDSPVGTFEVTSPADGQIISVQDFRVGNDYPYPDYRVVISHSCDLYSVFIHVGELQGVAAEAAAKAAESGNWSGSIPINAGEVIADESSTPGFDFSTFATSARVDMINPASYVQFESWKPYTANPFDFFPAEIKAAYEAKTLRTVEPIGGTIFYDIDGTAQGNWFVKGTNGYRGVGDQKASYNNRGKVARGYWDTHLAFAPDPIDPSSFIYSIGDWEGCPCQFMSIGNVDPSAVKNGMSPTVVDLVEFSYLEPDGSIMDPSRPVRGYKLAPGNEIVGSIAFQVNGDGSMTVEKRPGQNAASFTGFGANALTYVR